VIILNRIFGTINNYFNRRQNCLTSLGPSPIQGCKGTCGVMTGPSIIHRGDGCDIACAVVRAGTGHSDVTAAAVRSSSFCRIMG
jgi:hypothetical protein